METFFFSSHLSDHHQQPAWLAQRCSSVRLADQPTNQLTEGRTDGRTDAGRTYRLTEQPTDAHRLTDPPIDRPIGTLTDRRIDLTDRSRSRTPSTDAPIDGVTVRCVDRPADRPRRTDASTESPIDRLNGTTETDRSTDRPTDRPTADSNSVCVQCIFNAWIKLL